jgi:hypothetical protein
MFPSSLARRFTSLRAWANHPSRQALPPGSYWLTRFVLLRLLGFVYLVAFLAAAHQLVPLIGHDGLLPADLYVQRLTAHFGSRWSGFLNLPSVFWLGVPDGALVAVAWGGAALSLLVVLGYANAIVMLLLWALYTSIVNVGQLWYSYGWEIQLLETGFLGVFLCPLLDGRPFPRRAPPILVVFLYRWLIFRIMLGAGLIKTRGDACWRDLTCLYYHYETQPIPNPVSWWLHFQPPWFHQFGVAWNHFIELVVPWFGFWPRHGRHLAGVLMASFQVVLIVSGNLSFLNWLTLVPCLACLDDTFWSKLLPRVLVERAASAATGAERSPWQEYAAIALGLTVAVLSIDPVTNLVSPGQVMNTSFNRLNLVNTYGAFGSVGRERFEIIFEGTSSESPEFAVWREYEFQAKPGNPWRRPPIVAPYQPRIDWQIWFAAMATPNQYPWTVHFVWKLLHNDRGTLSLLANDPFPAVPPRFIRAQLYRYRFTRPDESRSAWWHREPVGLWLPPLSVDNPELRRFLEANGWIAPSEDKAAK